MNTVTGSCLCGKITFKTKLPVLWAGHCHCQQCQKAHGSAYATWINFSSANISDPKKYFILYDSGTAHRGFCKNCGSSFYFKYHEKETNPLRNDGSVYFTRANIQTPLEPLEYQNIYYHFHAPWAEYIENLPTIQESSEEK